MKTSFDLKSSQLESRLFLSRSLVLVAFVSLLFLALIARLTYLQVQTHEKYAGLSQNNRVKLSVISPVRGLIFDRHGRVLAENNPSYSLELVPEQVKDMDSTIKRLRNRMPKSPYLKNVANNKNAFLTSH